MNANGLLMNHACRHKCNVVVQTLIIPSGVPFLVYKSSCKVRNNIELCCDYNQTRSNFWHKLVTLLDEGYHSSSIIHCKCRTTVDRDMKGCPGDLAFSMFHRDQMRLGSSTCVRPRKLLRLLL